jgi:hypothetical protein
MLGAWLHGTAPRASRARRRAFTEGLDRSVHPAYRFTGNGSSHYQKGEGCNEIAIAKIIFR